MLKNINGHVLLTGMMGSGKSTVGPKLAEALHRPFYDLDEEIVSTVTLSIPEIFERYGEARFREWESGKLSQILSQSTSVVIALGGGSLGQEKVLSLIQDYCVIWLDCSTETLWQRVGDSTRPLVQKGLEAFRQMHLERRAAYAQAATWQVDSAQDPDVIVCTIMQRLGANGDEYRNCN